MDKKLQATLGAGNKTKQNSKFVKSTMSEEDTQRMFQVLMKG
jgi:hypothetical protein